MNGIYYYGIAFILIWFIAIIFKGQLEKYGVDVGFPVIMWRTKRLRGLINRIANISPRFWKWFMNFGILISIFFMILMAYALIISLTTITESANVAILLPGVEMPGSPIFIPFFYGFIALITVLVVHEFSHGILARAEKINIKSIGLILFAILPGAFVEPDEDEMDKAPKSTRLRIFAAGSMANLSLALVAFLIFSAIGSYGIPGFFDESGIEIKQVVDDSPSYGVLKEGMIITAINGEEVHDSDSYLNAVSNFKPNDNATIVTNQGTFHLKLVENPNNKSLGYMGIQGEIHLETKDTLLGDQIPWVLFTFSELFKWIFFLNFAVGTFNLLPAKPLDGGHMLEDLLRYKLPENIVRTIITSLTAIFWIIIIFSILYSLFLGMS
ncbi:MAG: site-2 protease family protein [Methanobacteriaceae archaeon]|jgi:membrane-associated protease RseP (regulator of RpoE activity)|nr:site-2 protease family protein [Methanobacteriaceae archaeon]